MKNHPNTKPDDKKSLGKLTTSEEDKEILYKKLISNDVEGLRKMDVKHLDLNIFQPVDNMEFIDEEISPLIYCSFYGRTDLAKVLMQNKLIDCDLETPSNKHTPLIVACLGSNYEMVKLLIDRGAEVNKPNLFFQTPLIVILMRLIEEYQSFEQNKICMRIAELLLLHEADPNWVFEKQKGYNLLHFLCSSTIKMNKAQKKLNYDLIKFLIVHKANINQKTLTDKLPIDLLTSHCNSTVISQLLTKVQEELEGQKVQKLRKQNQSKNPKVNKKISFESHSTAREKTKPEDSCYFRDQEIEWCKNNLMSIHGLKKV